MTSVLTMFTQRSYIVSNGRGGGGGGSYCKKKSRGIYTGGRRKQGLDEGL